MEQVASGFTAGAPKRVTFGTRTWRGAANSVRIGGQGRGSVANSVRIRRRGRRAVANSVRIAGRGRGSAANRGGFLRWWCGGVANGVQIPCRGGRSEVPRMASRFGGGAGAGARTRAENGGIRIFLPRNAGLRLYMSARGAGGRVRRSAAHSNRIESRVRRSVAHSVRLASRGGSVRPVGQKSVCTNQARRARSEQRKGSASGNTDMAALTENRLAKTRRAARARSDETRPRPAPEARH